MTNLSSLEIANAPTYLIAYPGSIVDISQLQYMLKKAEGYGYKKVGFILDRGYFGRENIQYMDECGYDFVIMVKGMSESVRRMILENKGEFENIRKYNIRKYKTFGKTIKKKLYISDEKERYFHIYYSDQKACVEHEQIEAKIDRMTKYLNSLTGEKATVGDGYKKYFKLEIYEDDGTIICARERTEVIQEEIDLCGYFVIVTSKQMTAEEALELYKSRDVSEKLFRGDKSYLGNRSLRVQSDEAANAKIFVEFVALIVRSRMYVLLKDEMEKLDKKPNYMTVPAAIRELEKIELVRQTDGKYRMDHAVTATQKIILKAFDMDAEQIQDKVIGLSRLLEKYAEDGKYYMARPRKMISLEEQIKKQEETVLKVKEKYDSEMMELKDLYAKRNEEKKKELLKAVENSTKTYEEIMAFICSEDEIN